MTASSIRTSTTAFVAALALGTSVAACGDETPAPAPGGSAAGSTPTATTPGKARTSASAADVDKAFVRQMIPHHEMAVDMAKAAQDEGEHAEVKALADEIIAAQTEEIEALRTIAKTLGVTPDEAMTEGSGGHGASMAADAETLGLGMDEMGMSMDMTALEDAKPFDRAFIDDMTAHHKGAVAMAKVQLASGGNAELKTIATAIIAAQEKELAEMARWRAEWYDAGGGAPAGGGHSGHGM